MMIFIIAAALLLIAALLFIIPPLWKRKIDMGVARERSNLEIYKDQLAEMEADLRNGTLAEAQFEQGRRELGKRLLEEGTSSASSGGRDYGAGRGVAVGVALVIPVLAVLIYLSQGNPGAINPTPATIAGGPAPHSLTVDQINAMVAKLAQRLRDNPNDPEGWRMLGRSLSALGRYPEAAKAMEKAVAVFPNDADLLADYADALAMSNGQNLEGRPAELIQRVLQIDPNHQKGLWLAGTVAYSRGNYTEAARYWERLLTQLSPGSQEAEQVENIIAEARGLAAGGEAPTLAQQGQQGEAPPSSAVTTTRSAVDTAKVSGTVSLSPTLTARVSPTDTVFVYARAPDGPRMPLAILRTQAGNLPMPFTLDESMAVSPAMSLANVNQVVIEARVSKSGNAMPQSGDLQGHSDTVAVGGSGVQVQINTVVP